MIVRISDTYKKMGNFIEFKLSKDIQILSIRSSSKSWTATTESFI